MREEAVRVAQKYADENKKYHAIIQEGEQYLVHQIRERANLALEQAKVSIAKHTKKEIRIRLSKPKL